MKNTLFEVILTASFLFLTAACQSGATGDEPIKSQPVSVTGITLNSQALDMTIGETATLTASVSPGDAANKSVLWTSSNSSVASVDDGTVTAKSEGVVSITAKSDDGGKTATCQVTVIAKVISVSGVSLNRAFLEMTEGDNTTVIATVTPENATDKNVTWTSSDESIATVKNGVITAIKAGSTTITVKTDDGGKTASCTVTVNATSNNGGNEDIYYDDWN